MARFTLLLSLPALSLLCFAPARPQSPVPAPQLRPAGRQALRPSRIRSETRKVCDYQIAHLGRKPDADWVRATLMTGVLATYRTTGDVRRLNEAIRWANDEGHWTPPRDQRHADALCCGQAYCELYNVKRDAAMVVPLKMAVDRMIASRKPGRVDWWWCDSLFMAPPMLARLADVCLQRKYIDFLNDMYWDSTDYLFDPAEGLYYRDKSYFSAKTRNGKKVFWSRGNGWALAGLARVIQALPADDPSRPRFVEHFRKMARALAPLQGKDGLWRSSLLDPEEFANPETSGTAFFCYGMAWGVNAGILDAQTYRPVAQRAWRGLVGAVNDQGRLGWVQQVAGSPGPASPDGTQEYAVGGFLLAGSEMAAMEQGQPAPQ
ncbi:MAG TPA: glycoside hydrolase family 88 protein [Armatimonadota bacterium]|jgi:rhamnogalacturonyl hydrolase YesR